MNLIAIVWQFFTGNAVIASDEGAKQSPDQEAGNEKGETGKGSDILLSPLPSHLSPPDTEIALSQAPRNDKMLNHNLINKVVKSSLKGD